MFKVRGLNVDDDMPDYLALVSGLDISGDMHESFETHLMVEYLTGELLCSEVYTPVNTETNDRNNNASPEYPVSSSQETLSQNLKS